MSAPTLGLNNSGKTLTGGMFSISVGGPQNGHLLSLGVFFFRILDCSELRYRYLNITVEPPECLVAGADVPVLVFPDVVAQPSSQEIPEVPVARTWVCDCTRE